MLSLKTMLQWTTSLKSESLFPINCQTWNYRGSAWGMFVFCNRRCGLRTRHMPGGNISKHGELHGWWNHLSFIEWPGRTESERSWADSSRAEGPTLESWALSFWRYWLRWHSGAQETVWQKGTAGSWGTKEEGRQPPDKHRCAVHWDSHPRVGNLSENEAWAETWILRTTQSWFRPGRQNRGSRGPAGTVGMWQWYFAGWTVSNFEKKVGVINSTCHAFCAASSHQTAAFK